MNGRTRVVVFALAYCLALPVMAQDKTGQRDDLDVTMQIIVDANARVPDEVVHRISLPTPRVTAPSHSASPSTPDAAANGQERAQEARELGREAAEAAKERAHEAAQQREEARDSNATDRDTDKDPPGRPDRPTPPQPRG